MTPIRRQRVATFTPRQLQGIYWLGALAPGPATFASFHFGWPLGLLPLAIAFGSLGSIVVLWRMPLTLDQRLRRVVLLPILILLAIAVGFMAADWLLPPTKISVD